MGEVNGFPSPGSPLPRRDAVPPDRLPRRLRQVVGEVLRGCRGQRVDAADDAENLVEWQADDELPRASLLDWGAPIEFDFDLRELIDDEAVNGLVRLFRLVSSAVVKDVIVRAERRGDGLPVVRVDARTGCVVLSPLS